MTTRSTPDAPGGKGLSPESSYPEAMLRQVAAHISGVRGTDPGTQAGIMQKLYDAMVQGNERITTNLQTLKDEFNRAGSNTTVRGLLSAGENTALFGGGPVTSGEQALERLRTAGMSSARMRQVKMFDVEGLRQTDMTAREDLNWQVRQYAEREVRAGRTPGGGGTDPEIVAAAKDFKDTGSELPRQRSAMESLTAILQKHYEGGSIGKIGMALGTGGDMASIFRGTIGSVLKDLSAAQPEMAPFIQAGQLAVGGISAILTSQAQTGQAGRSLAMSTGLPNIAGSGSGAYGYSTTDAKDLVVALRKDIRGMGWASSDQGAELGVTIGEHLGQMGVGSYTMSPARTAHDIRQSAIGVEAAATATDLPIPQVTQMLGQFMTQGGMSIEQALDQFRDLADAANASGLSVSKLSEQLGTLMQAGASTHMNMASLATLQNALGTGVNAGQLMAPAMTASGVSAIQYGSLLGFKSYDAYVQAQADPTKMFTAATQAIRRDHLRGNWAGAAAEEIMGQYGINLADLPADKRAALVDQIIRPDGINTQQLAQNYQSMQTTVKNMRDSQPIQGWEKKQGSFQFSMLDPWNQIMTGAGGALDFLINAPGMLPGGSGGGGGALSAAARAAYLRAHPGAAPEAQPGASTKPGAHQAVATAPTSAQEQGSLFAMLVVTAIAQALGTHLSAGALTGSEAAQGAAGHAHVAAARAAPHAPGVAAHPADQVALDVTLQGTLNVTDAYGRQIGTATIAPQHKRLDPHRVPKGHVPPVVGPQATHPRRDAQPV